MDAVCAELDAETAAENVALVAPAGTITEAGTLMEALLLTRVTVWPPVGAPPDRVTVQESVPAPEIEALAQETDFSETTPAPLILIAALGEVAELLAMVMAPV